MASAAFLVKVVQGADKMTFRCESGDTVLSLKGRIYEQTWLPLPGQKLKLKGRELPDEAALAELELKGSSRIMLMFSDVYYAVRGDVTYSSVC
jgi:hypothetical protein